MTAQHAFAAALLDAERPCPAGLVTWNGSDPARRFAVYRNNVITSLIDALADNFPVTRELVGDDFFRAMARAFVVASPPRSPFLALYGGAFPAFIEHFEPARSVPYLADVGRLERLRLIAYHAEDVNPLDDADWRQALARGDALPGARLRLHPSLGMVRSRYAVYSLWAAHQGELDLGAVAPYRPEDALIVRPRWDVLVVALRPGAGHFLQQLMTGACFGDSVAAATDNHPDFDLAATLADLVRVGAAVAIDFA